MNEDLIRHLNREELVLASKKKRANAFMIDELIVSVIFLSIIWEPFSALTTLEEKIVLINYYILEYMLLKIIYHSFFVVQYGASPGKMLMKIQILELSGLSLPNLLTSINRSIFRVVSEIFFYAGFIWGLLDPNSQTWHDKTARTIVVDV